MARELFFLFCILLFVGYNDAILGAQKADPGQFRYQVSIQSVDGDHLCSGAVLNENWIVTVAQCLRKFGSDVQNLRIVVGTNNIRSKSGSSYEIEKVVIHPDFEPSRYQNDIALIQTKYQIKIEHFGVFPVDYPSYSEDYKIENGIGLFEVTLSGWGPVEVS